MPYINTVTTVKITPEKEESIKEQLGKAIASLGKTESWLMLSFEDEKRMWFKGKNDKDMAMVDVSLFGKATPAQYDKMTAEVCKIISQQLAIEQSNIYVKYSEIGTWGYAGMNF